MNKNIKRNLFPVAILVVFGSLFVFLYCKGFRITYAPDLENSWDAISACATWAGVIMSSVAIVVAGIVAWRQNEISRKQTDVADKQNKIALFEKRFEIYNILLGCSVSVQTLKLIREPEGILKYLFNLLIKDLEERQRFENMQRIYLINCSSTLRSARFFFPQEIACYFTDVAEKFYDLIMTNVEIDGSEEYNKKKQAYFETIDDLNEKEILKRIETEMKMS